jgi:hypothetical protein
MDDLAKRGSTASLDMAQLFGVSTNFRLTMQFLKFKMSNPVLYSIRVQLKRRDPTNSNSNAEDNQEAGGRKKKKKKNRNSNSTNQADNAGGSSSNEEQSEGLIAQWVVKKRFSEMYAVHKELSAVFGAENLPEFPPKVRRRNDIYK